jgi:hypothetical protein
MPLSELELDNDYAQFAKAMTMIGAAAHFPIQFPEPDA